MNYELNLQDKRVRARVKKVVDFLSKFSLMKHQSFELPQTTLNDVFGQQQNELSRCLRAMLLISAGVDYVVGVSSLRYYVNKPNLKSLTEEYNTVVLGKMTSSVTKNNNQSSVHLLMCITSPEELEKQQLAEIESGDFSYTEYIKTPRLGHSLQQLPKEERNKLLVPNGYVWDYDIEAAAPSLLLQYALRVGPDLSEDLYVPEYFPALYRLINEKQTVREELQDFLVISDTPATEDKPAVSGTKKVKQLLHGILMGGSISISTKDHPNKIAGLLSNNKDRIELCNRCPFIIQLKKDLRLMWTQIELHEGKRYSNFKKNGEKKITPTKMKFTSKRKMASYLLLEAKIRNVFMDYLKDKNIRALQIHDGYQCDRRVDLDELEQLILNSTGYRVNFSEEQVRCDAVITSDQV